MRATPAESSARQRSASDRLLPGPLALAAYLLLAILFCAVYFRVTLPWPDADFASYVRFSTAYPLASPPFQLRVLVPALGRLLTLVGFDPRSAVHGVTILAVLGSVLAYRRYLAGFVAPRLATALAAALFYPLAWNYCLLSRLYFPFDMVSLLLSILALRSMHARSWHVYYPVLALALLNRESAALLVVAFAACLHGTMPARRMAGHLLAQVLLVVGIRGTVFVALGADPQALGRGHLGFNLEVLRDMALLRGHGPRDWVKLFASFGGLWLLIPFLRGLPSFLRRSLVLAGAMVVAAALRGIVDEVRLYAELIPVLTTPAVFAAARALGGVRTEEPAASGVAVVRG